MSLEQRVRKLERLNRILLVGLLAACMALGAFAATRTGTIYADRIVTGANGVWFESPDGHKLVQILSDQAGALLAVSAVDGARSVEIRGGSGDPFPAGGQIQIWGDEVDGGRGAALVLRRDSNGGVMRVYTLRGHQLRATLQVHPEAGACLRTWGGQEIIDEWP